MDVSPKQIIKDEFLETSGKSTISSDVKTKQKEKKSRKVDQKENKETSGEGFESSVVNDLVKQEKKKKKRKGAELDGEGIADRKKPRTKKPKTQPPEDREKPLVKKAKKQMPEDGKKPRMKKPKTQMPEDEISKGPDLVEEMTPEDVDLANQKSIGCFSPEFGPCGEEGVPKWVTSKPEKPKFGVNPVLSSTKSDSFEHESSRSGNSSPAILASPKLEKPCMKEGPPKPMKPKFGVKPSTTSSSRGNPSCSSDLALSKDDEEGKEDLSRPKKVLECGAADLARELGEIMKETEEEICAVERLKIPVIKPKKTVPVFRKTTSSM